MTKLSIKQRDDARALLDDHQSVCDALEHVSKVTWTTAMYVTHEDSNEDVVVGLRHEFAKSTLVEQKKWIEKELVKLGIEVG